MEENLIILYSGGADSRLMLEMALAREMKPYFVLIDYGQAHKEELEVAKKHLIDKELNFQVVKISGLNVNSGLTGSVTQGLYEGVHSHHVPGRNSIFLSLAFSIAEANGVDTIWYGPDYDDRIHLFPDCYQEYVVKVNELFEVAGSKKIKVEAPLMGMTKEMILDLLDKQYGVDAKEVFSGYGKFS